ncbi:MAG: methylthioribulose 1-phosphate dehydratase [Thioalkalivibrionaceae bacterium]
MENTLQFQAAVQLLAEAGRRFAARGWVPATAGNFSARLDQHRIAITVSGRHKGELDTSGLMVVDLDGNVLSPGKKPSAETFLHIIMYRRDPLLGCVLHTHSVNATVLSRLHSQGLVLDRYEVLKAFPGVETHESRLEIPVFPNDQDIPRLAAQVDALLEREPGLTGYLIEGHGLYTWGPDVASAMRHIEAFEFLFDCEITQRRLA